MKRLMAEDEFYNYLVAEYNIPFAGWDMSYLKGRRVDLDTESRWDYTATVISAMQGIETMLDMGTGGGERLASFAAMRPLPTLTIATEGYVPNIAVARQRLEPLDITVVAIDDDTRLPFADEQFDLIINRHASYDPGEVLRILKPGQRFITQQVGDQTNRRLHELFGYEPKDTFYPGAEQKHAWNLAYAVRELQDAGWQISEQKEEFYTTRYYDVGAIIYYLKAIPWEIPDFSVEKYFDKLLEIDQLIERDGYVDVLFHQFFYRGPEGVIDPLTSQSEESRRGRDNADEIMLWVRETRHCFTRLVGSASAHPGYEPQRCASPPLPRLFCACA